MTRRFADMEFFFRVLDHTSFALFCKPAAFPSSDLAQLISTYPVSDEQKSRNELLMVYNNMLFHNPPTELLQQLIEDDLTGHNLRGLQTAAAYAHHTGYQHISRVLIFLSKEDQKLSEENMWTGQACQLGQDIH